MTNSNDGLEGVEDAKDANHTCYVDGHHWVYCQHIDSIPQNYRQCSICKVLDASEAIASEREDANREGFNLGADWQKKTLIVEIEGKLPKASDYYNVNDVAHALTQVREVLTNLKGGKL